jgi:hypothetical protein
MHLTICLSVLAAFVAAAPRPQNELPTPTLPVILSTSLNVPVTSVLLPTLLPTGLFPSNLSISSTSKRRGGHSEPVPIFSKSCDCPLLATVAYPCYATDALAVSCQQFISYVEVKRPEEEEDEEGGFRKYCVKEGFEREQM